MQVASGCPSESDATVRNWWPSDSCAPAQNWHRVKTILTIAKCARLYNENHIAPQAPRPLALGFWPFGPWPLVAPQAPWPLALGLWPLALGPRPGYDHSARHMALGPWPSHDR